MEQQALRCHPPQHCITAQEEVQSVARGFLSRFPTCIEWVPSVGVKIVFSLYQVRHDVPALLGGGLLSRTRRCRDAKRRWSPAAALEHPWLQRLKPRGAKGGVPSGVVQRIQRFGSFNEFKRAALEQIAHRCLTQSMGLRSGAKPAAAQPPQEVVTARDALTDRTDVPMSDAHAAASAPPSAHIADADDTPADAAAPLPHSSRSPANARAHSGGNDSMSTQVASASAEGAHAVQGAVGDAVCLEKAQGLLQHMMVTGGGTVRIPPSMSGSTCMLDIHTGVPFGR